MAVAAATLLRVLCAALVLGVVLADTTQPAAAQPAAGGGFKRTKLYKYSKQAASSKSKAQKEAGFTNFSFASLQSLPMPKSSTKASDSLTGLPWFLTFQQQLAGGLPVNRFPNWPTTSYAPAAPAPAQTTTTTPPAPAQPAPAPAPARTPAPAPTPTPAPPATPSGCSTTDRSPAAVFACVNAVRTHPRDWPYPCDTSSWINEVDTPHRQALRADSRLSSSASRQARDMASTRTISHVGSDGSSMAQRIAAAGFTTFPQAENVAEGYTSALNVVMGWMCSPSHRTTLMSCNLDSVGTATAYDTTGIAYYVQDFGCSVTNACRC